MDPKNAAAYSKYEYWARATANCQRKNFEEAILDYDRLIELEPKNASAYAARGEAYEGVGDLEHSIADYDRAIDIDPKIKEAYRARGHAYFAKGDLEFALVNYNRAIEFDPQFKAAHTGRGGVYRARGDFERAIADFDQSIQIDPKDATAFRMRGIANLQAGSLSKSLDDLNQSSALNPKDAYAVLWLDIVAKRSKLTSRFAELAARLDMDKWPAPIVRLFNGDVTAEAVFAAATDIKSWKEKGQVCEANFYAGELALQQGSKQEAKRLFGLAADNCPMTFLERSSARFELRMIASDQ